jgi:hypothetical protein
MPVDLGALQRVVGLALARQRPLAGPDRPLANGVGSLAGGRIQQLLRRNGRHLDVEVDAVEQGAAELALVARDLVRRAAAGLERRAQEATATGVHGGDQLEARRELGAPRRARDRDGSGLQRFSQGLQRGPGELGEFVEKQHAVVRQRDLARPRR